eukprot:m.70103 g.70103  ORF g.70103 m.70103 type:complete len:738 (-) comp9996_c0_seq1:1089-3302(-)
MEIDFYWCEDDSESSPRDSPALGEPTSSKVDHGFQRAVDIPPRRNPFGAPPRERSRGSPPVHSGARNPLAAQRASEQRRPSGFLSSLFSVFDTKSPEPRPAARASSGAARPRSGTIVAVRPTPNRFRREDSLDSSFGSDGPRSEGRPERRDSQNGRVDRSFSGLSETTASPGQAHVARISSHRRNNLFRPENRAKLMAWVSGSLRTARLRRPDGKGMVLSSLGIEVLQQPCGDGLFLSAISRIVGDSPADETRQLFAGDALVEVNGTFVAHLDLEKIIMIIATAGKHITLKVTTSEALTAALTQLLEVHTAELATAGQRVTDNPNTSTGSVYGGKFWADAPSSARAMVSPDSSMLSGEVSSAVESPSAAINVSGISGLSSISPSEDDGPDAAGAPALTLTDTPLRTENDPDATPTQTPAVVVSSTRTSTDSTMDPDATPTETKKPEKEYGFYVKLPSEARNRRRRATLATDTPDTAPPNGNRIHSRVFPGSASDGAAAAAAASAELNRHSSAPTGEVFIDERRISRDIIGMRSSRTPPNRFKSPVSPVDVAPINRPTNERLPAGLLSPDDLDSTPPTPVLSLSDHVRVERLDECSKVVAFLAASGLGKYVELFEAEEIDYETLGTLTEQDLEKMGIDKLGARRKLLRAIRQLDIGNQYADSEISFQSSVSNSFSTRMARAMSVASVKTTTPSDLSNYGSMDRPTPDISEHGDELSAVGSTSPLPMDSSTRVSAVSPP